MAKDALSAWIESRNMYYLQGPQEYDMKVEVAEHDLENLIEAYHTLSDNADTLKAVNEEANAEVMEFAAGIMGQMLMRLEATGKISGPCLYSPEFTIN